MSRVCVVGSFMMDLIARAPRRPEPGETLFGSSFQILPGGKGFNQATAARRFGAQVSFVGRLGADLFGSQFLEELEAEGIDFSGVTVDADTGTGVGLPVVEDSGDNSIIVVPQANLELTPQHIRDVADSIEQADVLLLQLEIPLDTVIEAARIAKAAGTLVLLNPAPYRELPEELLELTDLIAPNEGEARAFLGDSAEPLLGAFQAQWDRNAVLTLGEGGVFVLDGKEGVLIDAHLVEVVDTVGAGDTFCGVLGACIADGVTLTQSARIANAAAALSVTRPGGAASIPSRDQVLEMLGPANAR